MNYQNLDIIRENEAFYLTLAEHAEMIIHPEDKLEIHLPIINIRITFQFLYEEEEYGRLWRIIAHPYRLKHYIQSGVSDVSLLLHDDEDLLLLEGI